MVEARGQVAARELLHDALQAVERPAQMVAEQDGQEDRQQNGDKQDNEQDEPLCIDARADDLRADHVFQMPAGVRDVDARELLGTVRSRQEERVLLRQDLLALVQLAKDDLVVCVEQEGAALVGVGEGVEHLFQPVELVLENDRRERRAAGIVIVAQRKADEQPAFLCAAVDVVVLLCHEKADGKARRGHNIAFDIPQKVRAEFRGDALRVAQAVELENIIIYNNVGDIVVAVEHARDLRVDRAVSAVLLVAGERAVIAHILVNALVGEKGLDVAGYIIKIDAHAVLELSGGGVYLTDRLLIDRMGEQEGAGEAGGEKAAAEQNRVKNDEVHPERTCMMANTPDYGRKHRKTCPPFHDFKYTRRRAQKQAAGQDWVLLRYER